MKTHLLTALIFSVILIACNNSKPAPGEEAPGLMDATRNFIRAALDGKFDEARKFLLTDSANVHYLNIAEGLYNKLAAAEKEKFATASILIHSKEEKIKDSIAVVIYSNSYKNNRDTLRLFKQNNNWLVDLKYLYEHDYDTLMLQIRKDTLR
jgi:hypothetical protein